MRILYEKEDTFKANKTTIYFEGEEIRDVGLIPEADIAVEVDRGLLDEDGFNWWYRREALCEFEGTGSISKDSVARLLKIIKRKEIAEKELKEFHKCQKILRRTKKFRIKKKQVKRMIKIISESKELLNFYDLYIGEVEQ